MTSRAALWLPAFTLACSAVVRAEPVYVTEQLVVAVTSTQEAESDKVGQVKSGDKLELLDKDGGAAHVRLPNGKEGWIKQSYVSSKEPLSQELEKLRQEAEKQKQEGDKLRQEVTRLQTELTAARQAPVGAAGTGSAPAATATPATTAASSGGSGAGSDEPIRDTGFLSQPERSGQTPWGLLAGIAAGLLLVGFVLGWTTLDRRIRQKYGGLKIY